VSDMSEYQALETCLTFGTSGRQFWLAEELAKHLKKVRHEL